MTATLNQTDSKRLARLAAEVGCTPQATLRHILQNGFDECEAKAAAVLKSLVEIAAGRSESADQVEAKADTLMGRHAGKTKAA